MKKIALISASVLALGAASIAADADGLSFIPAATDFSVSSRATSVSAAAATAKESNRGARISDHAIERSVRLISSDIAPVNSCDAAFWPYYPAECLKRAETADL